MAAEIREKLVLDGDESIETLERIGEAAKQALGKDAVGGADAIEQSLDEAKQTAVELAKAIERVNKRGSLEVAKLNSKEYMEAQKRLKDTQRQVRNASKDAASAIQKVAEAEADAADETDDLSGKMDTLGGGGMVVVANQALELANKVKAAAQGLFDFARAGAEAADIARQFEGLGEAVANLDALKRATAGVVDETTLQRLSVLAKNANLNSGEMIGLAQKITVAAEAQGKLSDVGEILDNTLRGELEGLKKVGLFVDLSADKYKGLTEVVKKQQIVKDLAVEGSQASVDALESEQAAYARTETSIKDLLSELQVLTNSLVQGSGFAEALEQNIDRLQSFGEKITWVSENLGSFGEFVEGAASRIGDGFDPIQTWIDGLYELGGGVADASGWVYRFATNTEEATVSVRDHTAALYDQARAEAILAQNEERQALILAAAQRRTAIETGERKRLETLKRLQTESNLAKMSEKQRREEITKTAEAEADALLEMMLFEAGLTKTTESTKSASGASSELAERNSKIAETYREITDAMEARVKISLLGGGKDAWGVPDESEFDAFVQAEYEAFDALVTAQESFEQRILDVKTKALAAWAKVKGAEDAREQERNEALQAQLVSSLETATANIAGIWAGVLAGQESFRDAIFSTLGELLSKVAGTLIQWAIAEAALSTGNFVLGLSAGIAMLAAAGAMSAYSSRSSGTSAGTSTGPSQAQRVSEFERQRRDERGGAIEVNLHGIPVPDATARELGAALRRDMQLRGS